MRTASIVGLRIAARLLGSMCEGNPRLLENRNWQLASQGVAGLIKDIESLQGHAQLDDLAQLAASLEFSSGFAREAERAAHRMALEFERDRQLVLEFRPARTGHKRAGARGVERMAA